jgi:hypothetical protein
MLSYPNKALIFLLLKNFKRIMRHHRMKTHRQPGLPNSALDGSNFINLDLFASPQRKASARRATYISFRGKDISKQSIIGIVASDT